MPKRKAQSVCAGQKRRRAGRNKEASSSSESDEDDPAQQEGEEHPEDEEMGDEESDDHMAELLEDRRMLFGGLSQSECSLYRDIQMRRRARLVDVLKKKQADLLKSKAEEENEIKACNEKYDTLREEWDGGYRAELEAIAAGGQGISAAKQTKAATTIRKQEDAAQKEGVDCLNVSNEDMMLFKLWDRIAFGASIDIMKCGKRSPVEAAMHASTEMRRCSLLALRALAEAGLDLGAVALSSRGTMRPIEMTSSAAIIRVLVSQFGVSKESYNAQRKLYLEAMDRYHEELARFRIASQRAPLDDTNVAPARPRPYPELIFHENIRTNEQLQQDAEKELGITPHSFFPTRHPGGGALPVGLPCPPVEYPPELAELLKPKPPRIRVRVIPTSPLRVAQPVSLVLPDQSAFSNC